VSADRGTAGDPAGLTLEEAREEVERLREEVRRHGRLYYVEARPEISDEAYDRLFRRLQLLEAAFPGLRTPDSPTQRVGAPPQEGFRTVRHTAPMLSLDSTQDVAEVRRFDERVRRALDDAEPTYVLEPKLDGASIELVYERGVLERAVTRGNGVEGEDVTLNIRTIHSVPLRLHTEARPAPPMVAFRGEVMMYISDFEAFNEELAKRGQEPYASPRNSAAGAIRQLDSRITAERKLHVLVYDIMAAQGASFASDRESVEAIAGWGFRTPERIAAARSVEEIEAYHAAYLTDRDDLDYEIDGIVIKLDDLAAREVLGATSHHPRWALAFKFEPRKEVTRIEKIGVQVGRTGVLTPVAFLLPVVVGGVTISRASLHNREELRRKDIREGDMVRVQRAGDVIPQVVEVVETGGERGPPFRMPDRCPACGTPVVEKGPFTLCPNRFGCPAQLRGRIVHFGRREALDIEGLGEETANLLVERKLVNQLADLFALRPEQLMELEGFAEKSATNLVASIAARKRPELRRFLVALGIPEVGVTVARDLAEHFGSFERIRHATREELEDVPGIGPTMSEAITDFFRDSRNAAAIDAILAHGVEPQATVPRRRAPLAGLKFIFTGGLERFSRPEAKRLVEDAGGRAVSSVSRETDYVVAGEAAGSKLDKAQRLGVPILDEAGFIGLLEEAGVELSGESEEETSGPLPGTTGADSERSGVGTDTGGAPPGENQE